MYEVLVDYLESHEVVEPYIERWIEKLEKNVPTTYSTELVQWICISFVFSKEKLFTDTTRIALRQAKGPVATLDLPIRDAAAG